MVVEFDLESVEGIAVGVAHGTLTLKEAKDSATALWELGKEPDLRTLWDLRDARFDLTASEIWELAEFIKEHAPAALTRTAFVVSRDLEFGLVRMYEVFREKEGSKTAVFRDRERALQWLSGAAD